MPNLLLWPKSYRTTLQKFSSRPTCMSLWNPVSCAHQLSANLELELYTLAASMIDLEAQVVSCESTTSMLFFPLLLLFLLTFLLPHSDMSDPKYIAVPGIFREDAIMLLRKFYIQENEKAPEPKQKKTRELKTEIIPLDLTRV
jgi:hypothetical protein